jgi:hypothetical protein
VNNNQILNRRNRRNSDHAVAVVHRTTVIAAVIKDILHAHHDLRDPLA